MLCPYCHHELKPLFIGGRPTGSYQCEQCTGTWLQYHTFSGLLPGLGGTAGHGTSLAPVPLETAFPHRRGQHGVTGSRASSTPTGGETRQAAGKGRHRFVPPWKRRRATSSPAFSSDWDICTYCGKPHPGSGRTCVHCNVERMRCPGCGRYMVGVRKHGVLVDICLSCRGLWFEKGRLEKLIERLSHPETAGISEAERRKPPSLLHQLAAFLEDTEPAQFGLTGRDPSVVSTLSSAFSAGLTGGRRILYDVLVLLGDLQSPPDDPSRDG